MIPMIIDFSDTGEVEALHRETVLDLGFLGPQSIERATDIRFNTAKQAWGIHPRASSGGFYLPPSESAEGFASYEHAREVEVLWLEGCRRDGVNPVSPAGLALLAAARKTKP